MNHKTILVTGAAGFIGSHVVDALLERGDTVIGVDNFSDYYDTSFKEENIQSHITSSAYTLHRADITDENAMRSIFKNAGHIDAVVHLAAQAGVRSSIVDPIRFVDVNVRGTTILFELCQVFGVQQVVFASSSSVYGNQSKIPFNEEDPAHRPVSPYAASKKASELIAYTFHHLYGLHMTGLRFFTVYGERGRPDMSPYLFADAILNGNPIKKYGDGTTRRDYTYIADVVSGVLAAVDTPTGYEIINLGNSSVTSLNEYIETFERVTGKKALIEHHPEQPGDVRQTNADITKARRILGWQPTTTLEQGLTKFVKWFEENRMSESK